MSRRLMLLGVLLAGFASTIAIAEDKKEPAVAADTAIDWQKARALYQREQQNEKLSAEEQAYLDRAKAARQAGQRPNAAAGQARPGAGQNAAQEKPRESTGMIALSNGGAEKYKGLTLGLYGDGKNEPPAAHLERAMAAAKLVTPLNSEGKADAGGKIGLMSIGMSNTTQEFSKFVQMANGDAAKNPKLVIVDGAQGGMDAADWADAQRGPAVWANADQRAARLEISPKQVQVIWIKQALKVPQRYGEFPAHADALKKDMATIVSLAKQRYPNLKLVYLSSRTYGGWALGALNPEPYAYESAFSVRGLIEDQIKGEKGLGYADAPVLLWGPYLWTDGTKGRTTDKLVWEQADTARDGTHPSESGRAKVGGLLLEFFKSDATAKGWFLK